MIFKKFKQLYPQERYQTADLLKGFAILMMIQVHLIELFAKPEINQSLLGKIFLFLGGPPAAPLFMAVMGYFLAVSKKSFSQNLKRSLILILGGILLNIGLNFHFLILIFIGKVQANPFRYIFGADILPLAGLSIILISIIKKISSNSFYTTSIISLLILIFILIFHSISVDHRTNNQILVYVQAFLWGNIEWSYFPLFPWAVYPLVGFLYRIILEQFNLGEDIGDFFALLSAAITFSAFTYGIVIASALRNYYHHNWLYTLWIFQFLILLTFSLDKLENFCGKNSFLIYVKWLGKNVTSVYVFQWLLIGNIATAIFQTQNEFALAVWFLVITIITSILAYSYETLSKIRKRDIDQQQLSRN